MLPMRWSQIRKQEIETTQVTGKLSQLYEFIAKLKSNPNSYRVFAELELPAVVEATTDDQERHRGFRSPGLPVRQRLLKKVAPCGPLEDYHLSASCRGRSLNWL